MQQKSQPTSPQDLSSLPPGAAAPWMAGGISTNHPAVPVLAPTSPNDVTAQPVQNVLQKALPPAPPQPQIHEQGKTNGKAAIKGVAIGKSLLKTTAKVALSTVMPPGMFLRFENYYLKIRADVSSQVLPTWRSMRLQPGLKLP